MSSYKFNVRALVFFRSNFQLFFLIIALASTQEATGSSNRQLVEFSMTTASSHAKPISRCKGKPKWIRDKFAIMQKLVGHAVIEPGYVSSGRIKGPYEVFFADGSYRSLGGREVIEGRFSVTNGTIYVFSPRIGSNTNARKIYTCGCRNWFSYPLRDNDSLIPIALVPLGD